MKLIVTENQLRAHVRGKHLMKENADLPKLHGMIKTGNKVNIGVALTVGESQSIPQEVLIAPFAELLALMKVEGDTMEDRLFNLMNIKKIDLSKQNIPKLPENIGILTKLYSLDLSSTGLEEIPESFGNLVNLENLYFENNKLRTIPDSMANLQKVQFAHMTNNPWEKGEMTKLQKMLPKAAIFYRSVR